MKEINKLECKNCGALLEPNPRGGMTICPYCDSVYFLEAPPTSKEEAPPHKPELKQSSDREQIGWPFKAPNWKDICICLFLLLWAIVLIWSVLF